MGMTVDGHIEVLKSYHHGFTGCAGNLQDSIDVAIDTMRKYQKIVDIVSLNGEEFKQCGLKELKEILEVIADGRN